MYWDEKRRAWMPETWFSGPGSLLLKSSITLVVTIVMATLFVPQRVEAFTATLLDLTAQVKGILPIGNGGTGTSSTLTGLVRGGASAYTAAELSGDATTSGSNAVTVTKVNGTSVPTNSAADQFIGTNASATAVWVAVPNCGDGAHALSYSTSTHTYGCQAITGANFADDETPTGLVNGSNTSYSLAHTPLGTSLMLFKNGQKLEPGGADFTLATATITMATAPATGTIITASYRY